MSGPVTTSDTSASRGATEPANGTVEIMASREASVGASIVRRALPQRARRTVGPWCFVDHMGPAAVTPERGVDIGPHPHIGLQTVTWLLDGEVLHRDSLGSEQVVRPGQLNLMSAGHGVAHAEERTGTYAGDLHGVQLWVAQPEPTRHRAPAFEHHAGLPQVEVGAATATVLVGGLEGSVSPARRDTDHVGIDLRLRAGDTTVPLDAGYEYAAVVLDGAVSVEGRSVEPGQLAYVGTGRDECRFSVTGATRMLLLGGVPFDEPLLMWWNFVARDRAEITDAYRQWTDEDGRFGHVRSSLPRIPTGPPPWMSSDPGAVGPTNRAG